MNDDTNSRAIQTAWRDFQEEIEPLRPTLYRCCRHLTRSPWDAEDLVQDTFARAFASIGALHRDGQDAVRAVNRVEIDAESGQIARLWNYFFTPEVIAEVASELGLPHKTNGIFSPCLPRRS